MQVVAESLKKVSANTANLALPTGTKTSAAKGGRGTGGRGTGGARGRGAKGRGGAAGKGAADNRPPCQVTGCTFGWNPGKVGQSDRDICQSCRKQAILNGNAYTHKTLGPLMLGSMHQVATKTKPAAHAFTGQVAPLTQAQLQQAQVQQVQQQQQQQALYLQQMQQMQANAQAQHAQVGNANQAQQVQVAGQQVQQAQQVMLNPYVQAQQASLQGSQQGQQYLAPPLFPMLPLQGQGVSPFPYAGVVRGSSGAVTNQVPDVATNVHIAEPVDNVPTVPGVVQGVLPGFKGVVTGMLPAFPGAGQGVGVPSFYGYGAPTPGPYGLGANTLPSSSAGYSTGTSDPSQTCTDGYTFTH